MSTWPREPYGSPKVLPFLPAITGASHARHPPFPGPPTAPALSHSSDAGRVPARRRVNVIPPCSLSVGSRHARAHAGAPGTLNAAEPARDMWNERYDLAAPLWLEASCVGGRTEDAPTKFVIDRGGRRTNPPDASSSSPIPTKSQTRLRPTSQQNSRFQR